VFVSLLMDDSVVGARTAGHEKEGGEDRQRHQRRPYPLRLLHSAEFNEEVVFHFHNCVFRLLSFVYFVVAANDKFANSLDYLLRQGTENPSVAARRTEGRCEDAAVSLTATCAGISCCN
jgi:hypothetical protein